MTPADAARVCCEMLEGYDREVFLALALSTANRVIGAHVCPVGTVDASVASPREVFRFCQLCNARSVIVARHAGLRVAAVSAIVNLAEGMGDEVLTHEGTLAAAAACAADLTRLVPRFLEEL